MKTNQPSTGARSTSSNGQLVIRSRRSYLRALFSARFATGFLALALVAVPTRAQDAGAAPSPPAQAFPGAFGEVLDVRVVNLEVVVTDKDGNRVYGLAPNDFTLTVDGQAINVEYFSEVRSGLAVETAADAAVGGVPALAGGQPVGTSYLVFIDDYFSIQRDRDRSLAALQAELPNLGPADRMAVVAYDGKALEMLSSWSGSLPDLERAFELAERRESYGLQRLSERRSADQDKRTFGRRTLPPGDFGGTRLTIDEEQYADQLAGQVGRVVSAATATLRSFAAPPGRKVMLVLSGGWPFSPAEYAVNDLSRPLVDNQVIHGPDLFRPLTDTANLLGYTIYGVDVPGLDATSGVDASEGGAPEIGAGAGSFLIREQGVHDALRFVSTETGGEPLLNAKARRPLELVSADTRSYYWLGFRPQRQGNDQRHDVEISVPAGLRARLRGDYLDFSRSREVTMAVESTLLFGFTSAANGLEVVFGRAEKSGIGKVMVPLTLRFPTNVVTFLPGAEGAVAQLELRVAALDDFGNQAEIPVIPFTLKQRGDGATDTVYETTVKLELRKRKHRVVVALYDQSADTILTTSAELSP